MVRVSSWLKMFDSMQPRPLSGPPFRRPWLESRRPNTHWPQRHYTPEFNWVRGCWNYPIFEPVPCAGQCRFRDRHGRALPVPDTNQVETVRYVSWRVALDHAYQDHQRIWALQPRATLVMPYERQVEPWEAGELDTYLREGREFPTPEMYYRIDDDPAERARSRSRSRNHPRTDAASSSSSRNRTAQTTDAASGTAQTTGAAGAASSTAQVTGAAGGTAQRDQTDDWLATLTTIAMRPH